MNRMKKRQRVMLACFFGGLFVLGLRTDLLGEKEPHLKLGKVIVNLDGTVSVPAVFSSGSRDDIASMGFVIAYDASRLAITPEGITSGPVMTESHANMHARISKESLRRYPGQIKVLILPEIKNPIGALPSGTVVQLKFTVVDEKAKILLARAQKGKRSQGRLVRWVKRQMRLSYMDFGDTSGQSVLVMGSR